MDPTIFIENSLFGTGVRSTFKKLPKTALLEKVPKIH